MKLTKNKLFVIITLVVLVVGLALFGILGMNNSVDYSKSYEINVSVDGNVNEASATMKEVSDKYFAEVGVGHVGYAFQQTEDGTLIYKFSGDISKVDTAALEAKITEKLDSTLVVTVKAYEKTNIIDNQIGWLLLALGLAAVATFVYAIIMEKLAGSVSVIASSIISALLFVALMGIARIPAQPFVMAGMLFSAALAAILSTVIVNRCNEAIKNVGNDKLSYKQVAENMTKASLFRYIFVLGAVAVSAIALIALAPIYVKFVGLQLIVAGLSAGFGTYAWSGLIWAFVKAAKKDRKNKVVEDQE